MTILCNNAGANFRVSFDDQTEEMWHTVMTIGLTGAFLGIKAAVPAMRRAGGGAIVNIGSLASTRSGGGSPDYGASKSGIVGLTTQSAAKPYASEGIRCNMVSLGHVDTPFSRQDNAHHHRQPGQLPAQTRRHPAGAPPNPRGHRQSVLVPGIRRRFDDYQGEPEGGRRRWHLEE